MRKIYVNRLKAVAQLLVIMLIAGCSDYTEPSVNFLDSMLIARPGIVDFGESFTVRKFVDLIASAKMDNGKNPILKGWTKNDNEYTLHLFMKKDIQLNFTHILSEGIDGKASLLQPVEFGNESISAFQFITMIASSRGKSNK